MTSTDTASVLASLSRVLDTLHKALLQSTLEKGWLPAGTSQNDLPNSAFLWLSEDYVSGKAKDKSLGRKFPIKGPDGKVDPHGWIAAWDILHGGMGGGSFAGGPSKEEVMAKLLRLKPAEITMDDGHASLKKSAEQEEALLADALEDGHSSIHKAYIPITKADPELGIIFGTASCANIFDREGHRIKEPVLERAAYAFMAKASKRATNTHQETIPGVFVASWVENGVWKIGFQPEDKRIAKAAANGDFVGFSIGGMGRLVPTNE